MHFADYSVNPARTEHAVQSATFVCELAAAVSPETVAKVASFYEETPKLRELFPRKREKSSLSINVSGTSVGMEKPSQPIGISFQRFATDGTLELALSLQESLMSVNCNRYSQWSSVSAEAEGLLGDLAQFVLPAPGVAVFGLQYVDEFLVSGNYRNFEPASLFARNGKFLPPHIFDRRGLWHSHSGWYQSAAPDPVVLANLNISLVRRKDHLVAQIMSAFRHPLPKPISGTIEFAASLKKEFDLLHDEDKKLLRGLLTEEAKSAIHLN